MSVFFFYILMMVIAFIFLLMSLFFKKSSENSWSDLPFECGFEPGSNIFPPFSLQFFSITIIFLIFDLEIIILLPIFIIETYSHFFFYKLMVLFLILLGLLIEWYDGSLDWDF